MKLKTILSTVAITVAALYFVKQSEGKQSLIGGYVQAADAIHTIALDDLEEYSSADLVSAIGVLSDAVEGIDADLALLEDGEGDFALLTKVELAFAKGSIDVIRVQAKATLNTVLDELKSRS